MDHMSLEQMWPSEAESNVHTFKFMLLSIPNQSKVHCMSVAIQMRKERPGSACVHLPGFLAVYP